MFGAGKHYLGLAISCFIRSENNKSKFKRNSVNAIKLCRHFFAPALCINIASLKETYEL